MPAALPGVKVAFTDKWIETRALPPDRGQKMYWDALLPSFGLRVSTQGKKAWVVQRGVETFDGTKDDFVRKVRRYTLGHYPAVSLAVARAKARQLLQELDEGKDPAREEERRRDELKRELRSTFGRIRKRFLDEYCDGLKADNKTHNLRWRTRKEYRRVLESKTFKPWEERPIVEITYERIEELLATVKSKQGGYSANRVHAYLRSLFNWCVSKRLTGDNPMRGMKRPTEEVAREFHFNEPDLLAVWPSLGVSSTFEPIFRLLMLTAQRREEVTGMRWEELEMLDGDAPIWRIPAERAKNECEHIVPLCPDAVALLPMPRCKSGLIFTTTGKTPVSGHSRAKDAVVRDLKKRGVTLSKGMPIDGWRLHDFRRTVATHMGEIGVPVDVVEQLLNHKSTTRGGIVGVYQRAKLLAERRAALLVWEHYLRRVTETRLSDRDIDTLRRECRRRYLSTLTANDDAPALRLVA